ncbi:DUF3558 domain-containing protein [Amycolatopsis thailandensis]|uniref:DUF3558 domain-containing protein n=1 Tax=Amycolatopsis thailandensis TaxID=589330 RepID=UPI003625473A
MRRTVLVIGAAVFALGACSSPTTNGTPTPTSSATSSSSSQLPGDGVPKVKDAIDLSRIKQAPCNALTDTQAKDLLGQGVESKGREGQTGPACMWSIPSTVRPQIDVLFSNLPDSGTARFYAAKGKDYKLLEPIEPIDGYPLTAYGSEDQRASKGRCAVALGTSDTETISIALEQSDANIGKKDPCDAAREAAIRVLATIRGSN